MLSRDRRSNGAVDYASGERPAVLGGDPRCCFCVLVLGEDPHIAASGLRQRFMHHCSCCGLSCPRRCFCVVVLGRWRPAGLAMWVVVAARACEWVNDAEVRFGKRKGKGKVMSERACLDLSVTCFVF